MATRWHRGGGAGAAGAAGATGRDAAVTVAPGARARPRALPVGMATDVIGAASGAKAVRQRDGSVCVLGDTYRVVGGGIMVSAPPPPIAPVPTPGGGTGETAAPASPTTTAAGRSGDKHGGDARHDAEEDTAEGGGREETCSPLPREAGRVPGGASRALRLTLDGAGDDGDDGGGGSSSLHAGGDASATPAFMAAARRPRMRFTHRQEEQLAAGRRATAWNFSAAFAPPTTRAGERPGTGAVERLRRLGTASAVGGSGATD